MTNSNLYGATPANIRWQAVRGDTSKLRIDFLEYDETTYYDISDWSFTSTTYDFKGDFLDELSVEVEEGYVTIVALPEITSLWGIGYRSRVAELAFDLQVTLPDNSIWTPVVGVVSVLADVTGSTL